VQPLKRSGSFEALKSLRCRIASSKSRSDRDLRLTKSPLGEMLAEHKGMIMGCVSPRLREINSKFDSASPKWC
jgi:hypothetical protein